MFKLSSTENGFRIITPTDLIQYKKGQSYNYLSEQEHPVFLEIKIDKLKIEIIRNRISSTILQDELIQQHDNMTKLHTNELHIYTDGSLNLNSVDGYNQIIIPELLAILTALLTVPINNNMHIYTDSQSAIDIINNMLQLRGIIERKLFKQNNYILLYAIDVIWNDKADKLAKKGSELALENEDRIVDLELILNNSNFEFIPKWSGVCIDRQIRKFCAQISDAIYEANWLYNKYWNNLKHRLNIYNNLLCPMCNKEEETLKHLTICKGIQENFKVIEDQIITKILKIIKKHNSKNNISYNELEKILFKYKDEVSFELKEKNRVELTRGLISSSIMMNLQQKTFRKLSIINKYLPFPMVTWLNFVV
ncbi:hypothetical protein GLOIN_2v1790829 [Rhizophagus clarus]|uniref:RNase H type-1 domain-containing protein n=1 Tax=Rhizophagus clarus TaxID=94130 RepID=A0A8H3MA07_9GLOM|nr:hypothetical protein GLOIN_2v1790829 [Rhizophagus clarus]